MAAELLAVCIGHLELPTGSDRHGTPPDVSTPFVSRHELDWLGSGAAGEGGKQGDQQLGHGST
jgi:hypothetical protein